MAIDKSIDCIKCGYFDTIANKCNLDMDNHFGCEHFSSSLCNSCFYFSHAAECKKGYPTMSVDCNDFTPYITTQHFWLSQKEVYDLCLAVRSVQANRIDVRYTGDSHLSANTSRERILFFIDKIFVRGIQSVTPDFFAPYVYTLEPFMYKESIKCVDPAYQGCDAHIFEYPCGTQSIQIKIVIQEASIKVISFHQGERNLDQLFKVYTRNSNVFPTVNRSVQLYFGTTILEGIFCNYNKDADAYYLNAEEFFTAYRTCLLSAVQNIIQTVYYLTNPIYSIQKLSTQGAISVGSLASNKFKLSDIGMLHANLTLLTLSDSQKLQETVMRAIAPILTEDNLKLLWEAESNLMNKLNLQLPERGTDNEFNN